MNVIRKEIEQKEMNKDLTEIKNKIYDKCEMQIFDFENEPESLKYNACRFELNGLKIICRSAKVTPKKIGQFVTFWKRKGNGEIEPFYETDLIDFYAVNVRNENQSGQFVFPKSVLIKKGIISTDKKEGKRAFRVYPSWDFPKSKQAEKTQKWQLNYFFEIGKTTDLKAVTELYKTE